MSAFINGMITGAAVMTIVLGIFGSNKYTYEEVQDICDYYEEQLKEARKGEHYIANP